MDIYTLTDMQYKALKHSSGVNSEDGEATNICIAEPDPRGTQEERDAQIAQMKEFDDLVSLRLMKDISKLNEEGINKFVAQWGFGLRFFLITERGLAMFKREHLVVN